MSDINNFNINNKIPTVKQATEFNPKKQDENIFAKETVGNFFNAIENTFIKSGFSWQDNIDSELNKVNKEQAQLNNLLGTPTTAQRLDLTC